MDEYKTDFNMFSHLKQFKLALESGKENIKGGLCAIKVTPEK